MSTGQCSAISNAMAAKRYTSAQLAAHVGMNPQRIDGILSGRVKPTQHEFSSIARALNLSNPPTAAPHHVAP